MIKLPFKRIRCLYEEASRKRMTTIIRTLEAASELPIQEDIEAELGLTDEPKEIAIIYTCRLLGQLSAVESDILLDVAEVIRERDYL